MRRYAISNTDHVTLTAYIKMAYISHHFLSFGFKQMKHIALCLDYDNCILNRAYIIPFTPAKIGDIKTNTSIIDINRELWDFVVKISKENPDLELLTLVHFSARQDAYTDEANSVRHKTESYFLAMIKIHAHLDKLFKEMNLTVKVELNRLLMTDIHRKKPHGETHTKALEDIDYSPLGRGMIVIRKKHKHDHHVYDPLKVSYVFVHVHAIVADAFYYFDDRLDILKAIEEFYQNEIGQTFIPKGVKVMLLPYDDGAFIEAPVRPIIVGTGERCHRYAELMRVVTARKESLDDSTVFPAPDNGCRVQLAVNFNRLFQEYLSPEIQAGIPSQSEQVYSGQSSIDFSIWQTTRRSPEESVTEAKLDYKEEGERSSVAIRPPG